MPKVITKYDRRRDRWIAVEDCPEDERTAIGTGSTESEAINDLMRALVG